MMDGWMESGHRAAVVSLTRTAESRRECGRVDGQRDRQPVGTHAHGWMDGVSCVEAAVSDVRRGRDPIRVTRWAPRALRVTRISPSHATPVILASTALRVTRWAPPRPTAR